MLVQSFVDFIDRVVRSTSPVQESFMIPTDKVLLLPSPAHATTPFLSPTGPIAFCQDYASLFSPHDVTSHRMIHPAAQNRASKSSSRNPKRSALTNITAEQATKYEQALLIKSEHSPHSQISASTTFESQASDTPPTPTGRRTKSVKWSNEVSICTIDRSDVERLAMSMHSTVIAQVKRIRKKKRLMDSQLIEDLYDTEERIVALTNRALEIGLRPAQVREHLNSLIKRQAATFLHSPERHCHYLEEIQELAPKVDFFLSRMPQSSDKRSCKPRQNYVLPLYYRAKSHRNETLPPCTSSETEATVPSIGFKGNYPVSLSLFDDDSSHDFKDINGVSHFMCGNEARDEFGFEGFLENDLSQ